MTGGHKEYNQENMEARNEEKRKMETCRRKQDERRERMLRTNRMERIRGSLLTAEQ
jgi:hypothetical protein